MYVYVWTLNDTVARKFQIRRELSRNIRNILHFNGTFWNILESYGTFSNILDLTGTFPPLVYKILSDTYQSA